MKKILILAAWMLVSIPAISQKTDAKFSTKVSSYLKKSDTFLAANGLSSQAMRKMMEDTFRDKQGNADFSKALDKYFSSKYESDLAEILTPYYSENMNLQQIDSLTNWPDAENVKRAQDGLVLCADADYRDKKVDETLTSVAEKTGKKKKKKNLKKFTSDCTEDYRSVLESYNNAAGNEKMSEDMVNAVYHTIAVEDLGAYTSYLRSEAVASGKKTETAIVDDIYDIQSECISKFQSWTYKAYPSLFTKKQVQPKKRKGRKGKSSKTKQDPDAIIDGGVYH